MPYWKTVLVAIGWCLALGVLWQIVNLVRVFWSISAGGATGIGFVTRGWLEFLTTVVVAGWVLGSAWYLVRR